MRAVIIQYYYLRISMTGSEWSELKLLLNLAPSIPMGVLTNFSAPKEVVRRDRICMPAQYRFFCPISLSYNQINLNFYHIFFIFQDPNIS